jgi:hypothetical protein
VVARFVGPGGDVHRDLVAYAEILAWESGHPVSDPRTNHNRSHRFFWAAAAYLSQLQIENGDVLLRSLSGFRIGMAFE